LRPADPGGTTPTQVYGVELPGHIQLSPGQMANVKAIIKTGQKMHASSRDIQIAIMTAFTESGFMTSAVGDGGLAIGIFQQHPSWGSYSQRTNAAHAAQSFFTQLLRVKNRDKMQPWQAAQAVQRSATSDGSNYKKNWNLGQKVSTYFGVKSSGTGLVSGGSGGSAAAGSNASLSGGGGVGVAYDANGAHLTPQQLAENYGYAWSFLKQHSDVWHVFQSAVSGNWTADKFKAAIRGTNWYKVTADSVRQYQLQAASDPKTVAAKQAAIMSQMADSANAMGAIVSGSIMQKLAKSALMYNWNDSQIRAQLANYVTAKNGIYNGQAGTDAESLGQLAWRNGIKLAPATLQNWVKSIEGGKTNVAYYTQYLRNQAKALAPGFSNQLDGGMDLYDIASPYMQAKAQILELDPSALDLFDPDIRQALSAKDSGGKPTSLSLWQFEQNMRMKPEYMKTTTARDQAYGIAHKVLNDFGLMGG
jgi:hypothetical protein